MNKENLARASELAGRKEDILKARLFLNNSIVRDYIPHWLLAAFHSQLDKIESNLNKEVESL